MAYGLLNQRQLKETVISVCDCLGYGANKTADELLIETAGVETSFGMVKDLSVLAGLGLTQFDKIPFQDVKDRCRKEDKAKIREEFDIDIDLVLWEHLRYNPLLALIFTRLKYKKIAAQIPKDLKGRANYWKEHYNSYAKNAKGTVEKYIYTNTQKRKKDAS